MSREDDLRDALSNLADELYRYDNNPSTWLAYLVDLLNRLEQKATEINPVNSALYIEMITRLEDGIRNRVRTGGW
jgi:hypothetical protein